MVKEKEKRCSTPSEVIIRPSTAFIAQEAFDVNIFLKKTLSNFSVDKANQSRTTDEETSSNDDKRNECSNPVDRRSKNQTAICRNSLSPTRKSCAYCGQRFASNEASPSPTDLYCVECYHFFTQKRRSEIRSRVADMANENNAGGNRETSNLLKAQQRKRDDSTRLSPKKEKNHQPSPARRHSSAPRRQRRDDSPPDGRHRNSAPQFPARTSSEHQPKHQTVSGKSAKRASPATSRRNSWSSSSSTYPTCRICHLPGELGESLITPCRCSGTVQYVHTTCLVHWLEISSKKVYPSPQCELCGYHFRTHHCYRFRRLHYPQCDHRDKVLHMVFFLMAFIMIGCAVLSSVYLRAEKGQRTRSTLNPEDIVVIACSVLFFCAFFVAVFTQYRAEASVCRLFLRCWLINKHWRVKDYDRNLDYDRVGKASRSCEEV